MTLRRGLVVVLGVLLAALQFRLWWGDGGVFSEHALQLTLQQSRTQAQSMAQRNASLQAEVDDLRKGGQAIEARARRELGMVRQGETFYLVVRRD